MSLVEDDPHAEAARVMTICNSCRYCEGICAVFPAMEMRASFLKGDIDYLANLCHGCSACYYDCQYSPPHEFAINIPATFATVRQESYRAYAWPAALSGLFRNNLVSVASITLLSVAAFTAGFFATNDASVLFAANSTAGSFYRLMPHDAMAATFGAVFVLAMLALALSVRGFWRAIGGGAIGAASSVRATDDAARLKYLDGGGGGCMNDESPRDRRRLFHHLTFYGFLLCFAATCVATLYHYLLGLEAPYRWFDLPVVLGTLGGIGLVIGTSGLALEESRRDPALRTPARGGIGKAFLAMLWLTGATGLLLLVFRGTPAMGLLLALHLGVVFGLFATMPYGKFVHGLYRYASLLKYAGERH